MRSVVSSPLRRSIPNTRWRKSRHGRLHEELGASDRGSRWSRRYARSPTPISPQTNVMPEIAVPIAKCSQFLRAISVEPSAPVKIGGRWRGATEG